MTVDALTAEDRAALSTRPRHRADCAVTSRPCPWVGCRHHLYLDVNPRTGSIKINFPDREPDQLEHSCALDVDDGAPMTLDDIGARMNLTHERVRQIEIRALLGMGQRLGEVRP